jgi:hypothetical protein
MQFEAHGRKIMISGHLLQFKKTVAIVFVVLFGFFGIQSSYADYYPSGIQQNVSEQTLIDNGWTLFYEQTYGTIIGNSSTPIRPSGQYVILSGKAAGSSTITLAAAAPTAQVFTETAVNTPQLLNGTYWYYSLESLLGPNFGSIGFAPTSSITQVSADTSGALDPLRLSWHLDAIVGGYRLGTDLNLNSSTAYLKQVWTWNGPAAPAPAEAYVRKSTNLQFNEAMYESDKLSDPDGQLRKTVDLINAKYGNLIK